MTSEHHLSTVDGEQIRAGTVLPGPTGVRCTLHTADGLTLVGELAAARGPAAGRHPRDAAPAAHPRRLHGQPRPAQGRPGGCRRSPASRCCASTPAARRHRRGTSEGAFDDGGGRAVRRGGRHRVRRVRRGPAAADRWLLGWSFGTDLALMHGLDPSIDGAILLSPPLRFCHRDAPRRVGGVGQAGASRWCRSSTTTCARPRRATGSRASRRPRWSASTAASTCGSGSRRTPGARRDRQAGRAGAVPAARPTWPVPCRA